MSKKFKSQASSARAANTAFGTSTFGFGGGTPSSSLSYVAEQPDLSGVSDPNVVVSLRNLGKKDSTTKSKALEDLSEHINSTQTIEDAVVSAWISLYPRTSIDSSRRVRQLSHSLQGSLTSLTTKRIVPHLPKAVGSWLSGLYDSDKAVARTAQDALNTAFTSPDKQASLWKKYRNALVDYAEDALLVQSTATLSDERSTSKDDADAKYVRVVGSSMLMLAQLILTNTTDENSRSELATKIDSILTNAKTWTFAYHPDPYLRRSSYALVSLCVEHFPSLLDWSAVSTCFLAKSLTSSQFGSSGSYMSTLLLLTKQRSTIWTTEYSAKTAAYKKLVQCLSKGSQRGPEDFWRSTNALIKATPSEVILSGETALTLQKAEAWAAGLRDGVQSQEEPRQNLTVAWSCYLDICFWLQNQLAKKDDRSTFLESHPLPMVSMYMNPDLSTSTLPANSALQLSSSVLSRTLATGNIDAFEKAWNTQANSLIDRMKLSLPESSKDFVVSQDAVIAHTNRLSKLQQMVKVSEGLSSEIVEPVLYSDSERVVRQAVELLSSRNAKPYGAMAVLQDFGTQHASLVKGFIESNMPALLDSPSATRAVHLAQTYHISLNQHMQTLLRQPDRGAHGQKALCAMLKTASPQDVEVLAVQQLHLDGSKEQEEVILALLNNPDIENSDVHAMIMKSVFQGLSTDAPKDLQLAAITLVSSLTRDGKANVQSLDGERSSQLHAKLLLLGDSADSEVSEQASVVLKNFTSTSSSGSMGSTTTAHLIHTQLAGARPQLAILSLIELAESDVQRTNEKAQGLQQLLPTAKEWETAMRPHLGQAVPSALSITSPLKGAVHFLSAQPTNNGEIVRDAEDFSMLFRLVLYSTRLLRDDQVLSELNDETKQTLVSALPTALQFVNEKLTLDSANDIWLNPTPEVVDEASDVLFNANSIVRQLLNDGTLNTWIARLGNVDNDTTSMYHEALACHDVIGRFVEKDGPGKVLSSVGNVLKDLSLSKHSLKSATLVSCLRESLHTSGQGKRLLNELVSQATELKSIDDASGLSVVLLNVLLADDSEPLDGVQSQRLVFLMQNLLRLLLETKIEGNFTSEVCRLLMVLLPAVRDIYGDHWAQLLDWLDKTWTAGIDPAVDLPLLHFSLRLCSRLKTLAASEDINEDLLDAWKEAAPRLDQDLLSCLQAFEHPVRTTNQPRQITADVLGRLLKSVEVQDGASFFPLAASPEMSVSKAAYSLLHRAIPKRQKELSLELALENQIFHLPPGLLQLLSDIPAAATPILENRTYLLCWQLAFDHFENASYKLREAYMQSLKEASVLHLLLDRIGDLVRITNSRPVDASKYSIDSFELDQSESDTKEIQWLAVHLYFRSLLFVPSLVKTWFIEQKNRIRTPLEAWTQKYLSSHIVTASFDTVTQWADIQDQDDNPVTVKASPKAFELVASMEIDPESPPIAISVTLPTSYPLNSPSVISKTRVAVSDKNWQSWLRTFQIIIFSTGSIIEGLVAFRRNVQGAIKGHGECAICYSIIGTDMQTPNKKCGTCKNTFHGSCLFRWFKSSNSSSCPLCRNNFNYA